MRSPHREEGCLEPVAVWHNLNHVVCEPELRGAVVVVEGGAVRLGELVIGADAGLVVLGAVGGVDAVGVVDGVESVDGVDAARVVDGLRGLTVEIGVFMGDQINRRIFVGMFRGG